MHAVDPAKEIDLQTLADELHERLNLEAVPVLELVSPLEEGDKAHLAIYVSGERTKLNVDAVREVLEDHDPPVRVHPQQRLAELHAKGWANLSDDEKDEAMGLVLQAQVPGPEFIPDDSVGTLKN